MGVRPIERSVEEIDMTYDGWDVFFVLLVLGLMIGALRLKV